jgi:hypothetical protein|nr:hypothetical protein [Kofleriaceae bacterium]
MSRLVAAVAAASLVTSMSCAAAVKHPALAAGVFGGVVGFGGCYLQGTDADKCAGIGGAVGVGLGAIAALVLLLSPPDEHGGVLGGGGAGSGSDDVPRFGSMRHLPDAGVDAAAPVAPPIAVPPPVVVDAGVAADATP